MSAFHETFHFLRHWFSAKKRHGIHSPLVYHLSDQVFSKHPTSSEIDFLRSLKKQWLKDNSTLTINDFGAGPRSGPTTPVRTVADIAKKSTSSNTQAQYLFQLAKYLKPRHILELGTNLGWTTMHFSMACPTAQIITVEGSDSLFQFSTQQFKALELTNITAIQAEFGSLLSQEQWTQEKFDLVYIDGNHRKEPTLLYCELLQHSLSESAVLIIDDIYWSREMTEAWNELRVRPEYSLSVDCFHFGLLFLEKRNQKEHFLLRI